MLLLEKVKDGALKKELESIYLNGVKNTKDKEQLKKLFQEYNLTKFYKISDDNGIINHDPARRYFESYLAFYTLKNNINNLEIKDMRQHYKEIYDQTRDRIARVFPEVFEEIELTLKGQVPDSKKGLLDDINTLFQESGDMLSKAQFSSSYKDFSSEEKEKLTIILRSIFLSVALAKYGYLPLHWIYKQGIFSTEYRGLDKKEHKTPVQSAHLGLMKNFMPLPKDSLLSSDEFSSYLRSPDRCHYVETAEGVKDNFAFLVFPFASSTSGTMLCQLRTFVMLMEEDKLYINKKDQLYIYFKCLISSLLFTLGGHSLYEFVLPFTSGPIQFRLSKLPEFNKINIQSLFYENNQKAFQEALQKTITYNHSILKKMRLNQEIEIGKYWRLTADDIIKKLDDYIAARAIIKDEKLELNTKFKYFKFSADLTRKKVNLACQLKKQILAHKNFSPSKYFDLIRNAKDTLNTIESSKGKFKFFDSDLLYPLNSIEEIIYKQDPKLNVRDFMRESKSKI